MDWGIITYKINRTWKVKIITPEKLQKYSLVSDSIWPRYLHSLILNWEWNEGKV